MINHFDLNEQLSQTSLSSTQRFTTHIHTQLHICKSKGALTHSMRPVRLITYQINYSYYFIPPRRFETFRGAELARYSSNFAARAKTGGV